MSTITEDFATNLTAILDAIAKSVIYTDIEAMYDDGRLQKDQMDKVVISFHEKALSMSAATAENIALKGYRLDEIITADLAKKYNDMNVAVADSNNMILTRNAEIAIKQADSTSVISARSAEIAVKQADSTSVISTRSAEIAVKQADSTSMIATRSSELALKTSLNAEDVNFKKKQTLSEIERASLLVSQTRGFYDNVTLEFAKFVSENIGMIESGGNTAPVALWDLWTTATNDVQTLSEQHPSLQIVV